MDCVKTTTETEELELFLDISMVPREHDGKPMRLMQRVRWWCAGYIHKNEEDVQRLRESMLQMTARR